METMLRIDCSPRRSAAHSWRFADEVQARLQAAGNSPPLVHRILSATPPSLVDEAFTRVMTTHMTAEKAREAPALDESERLISELESASTLILATPVHNFTVPATLKAWIDQIVRFGRSFRSTPEGKIGLLRDRPTWLVLSSGGYFSHGPARQPDFATPYLEAILATVGIRDLRLLRLEGLSRGEEAVAAAYRSARQELDRHLAEGARLGQAAG